MALEKTLTIIKPDVVFKKNIGSIINRYEISNFKISAMKMLQLNELQAKGFYAQHSDKLFFKYLIRFIISGPIIVIVLEANDIIKKYRDYIGSKDPSKALSGTIRSDYGKNIIENAVHGSDSVKSSELEITFFFGEGEIY